MTGTRATDLLLVLTIAALAAFQIVLIFALEINWDEFFFLNHIYAHQAGTLSLALQTGHVWLLFWLTSVPGTEVAQVEAGRLAMFACEMVTTGCIYLLGRHVEGNDDSTDNRRAGLIAVFAYLAMGYTLWHGFSFRADPLAAMLMTAAVTVMVVSRLNARALATLVLLIVAAGMVTVKVIFFAPALAGVTLLRITESADRPALMRRILAAGIAIPLVFAAVYLFHQADLADADVARSGRNLGSAGSMVLLSGDFFPGFRYFVQEVRQAPLPAIMIFGGIALAAVAALSRAQAKDQRQRALMVLALASPLLSFLFYRNVFPYFFSFIFPTATLAASYFVQRMRLSPLVVSAAILIATAFSIAIFVRLLDRPQDAQIATLRAVHAIFPQAVPVIDRNAMVASFPKRGFFMSSWGLTRYVQENRPVYPAILAAGTVPLLLLNSPVLEDAVGASLSAPLNARLLPADRQVLSENYIVYWGKVWVAGKRLDVAPALRRFANAVPGTYVLEAGAQVLLNGRTVTPGATIRLGRGSHEISSEPRQTITLRWAAANPPPATSAPTSPIYHGMEATPF